MEDDRSRFFAAVERFLAPPVTLNGAGKRQRAYWRAGAFAPRIGLAVDALDDGTMRVHLFSDDPDKLPRLRSLAVRATGGHFPPSTKEMRPVFRLGDRARRGYFGFTWTRKGGYAEELENVRALVDWFVSIREYVS